MSELFDKSIRTLELPRVLQLLSEQAVSPEAKELALAVRPETDYEDVLRLLDQTDGARAMIVLRGAPGFSGVKPVKDLLDRADRGGSLNIPELIRIGDLLYAARRAKEYFNADAAEPTALDQIFLSIHGNRFLEDKIRRCISDENTVADAASPELADIRRHMRAALAKSRQILQKIISSPSYSKVLQDNIITQRDGRFVVPVKADQKGNLPGLIHDVSSTGATVFVEPMGVVQANNEYAELQAKEQAEIDRILAELSADAAAHRRDIQWDHDALVQLDLIFARGELSYKMDAIRPQVRRDGLIRLRKARHPLLDKKTAVPIDIELGGAFDTLVITGPNTGGKTVSLKTLGLLTLMTQCGLHIPAGDRSEVSVYERVLADIGDEQSIENDLSTYSSHLTNMKYFVKNCNERTIILIDEFGSGTEPQIGGAIAEALLDRFNRNHSFGVITTHYQNLKHFAEDTEGIVNGAMLYDRHLMQPLFKLSIGNPGSSFAVEIARKIGLPEDVIADASANVGADYINMDKYLQDIVRDKRYWESKRQNIRQQEKKLEDVTSRYEQDLEAVNKQRKEIIREAKAEAQRILAEANAKIENTVREIKEAQAEKEQTKLARKALEEFKNSVMATEEEDDKIARKMAKLKERNERKKQKQKVTAQPIFNKEVIEVGDNVRLKGQVSAGTVMELQGKQAVVAFGMIKSTVKLEQLEKVSKGQIKREIQKSTFVSSQTTDNMHEKKINFKQEIDVRGMRGDEALQSVTYFIDDAIQVGAGKVRILHGTGTGILRQLIRDYLRTVPGVRRFQDEHVQFGGAGITVVEFD